MLKKSLAISVLVSLSSIHIYANDNSDTVKQEEVISSSWDQKECNLQDKNACKALLNKDAAIGYITSQEVEKYTSLEPNNLSTGRIAMAFGTDGCFPSSPVWSNSSLAALNRNEGSEINNKLTDQCAYKDQFDKAYVLFNETPLENKKKNDGNTYSARIYGMYAVKDETGSSISSGYAHRHEWEHIIVWMKNHKPDFVSVTQHSSVETKKAKDVAHLENDPNTFAVKYIHGRFAGLPKISTHFFDFMDKDKNGVVKNTNPTPSGKWYGLYEGQLVDFKKTSNEFQFIIQNKDYWGETRVRINDKDWLNGKVCNIAWCPFDWMKSNVIPWKDVKVK